MRTPGSTGATAHLEPAVDGVLVGRDAEWSAIAACLDDVAAGHGRHLVIEGPAGMGKTVLWERAVDDARRRGMRVLDARPAQAEADLAYAGLHDLFRGVADHELGALPTPQRDALDAALYRGGPTDDRRTDDGPTDDRSGAPAEAGAIAIASLTLVRQLATRGPVLVAVDDIPWLDQASLAPVRFLTRRVAELAVGVLVTARTPDAGRSEDAADHVPWIEPGMAAGERLALGPLSIGAIHRLLGDHAGLSLPRPALVRLHELTAGNPYLAIELVRAWGADAVTRVEAGEALPGTLDGLLRERIERLGPDERLVAQAVAAVGRPREGLLARILGEALDVETATRRGIESGVLRTEDDRIRCSHPLIASVLVAMLTPAARRTLHGRIAAALDDPIDGALHRAAATDGPDESVAGALDAAASAAAQRGATLEAVTFRERALELTPAGDVAATARRQVALADAIFTVGDPERAQGLLELVPDGHPDVPFDTRLEGRLLLATIHWFHDTPRAVAIAEQVLDDAGDDRPWLARIHARLSWMLDEDIPRQAAHGAAALRLLDPEQDPVTYAFAVLNHAMARLLAGEGSDVAAIELGERLQASARSWEYSTVPAVWAKAMDRFDDARVLIDRYIEHSRARGDESSMAQLLSMHAELEAWAGRSELAMELAQASVALAEQSGQAVYRCTSLARRGWIRACLGDLDAAEADAHASLELATPPLTPPVPLGVLGFVALTRGDPASTVRHLAMADAMLTATGMREPATYRFHGDLVEALVLTGALDEAERQVARLEERALRVPRPWIGAVAARGRALLLGARGDVHGALEAFGRALVDHETMDNPLELARTRLAHGAALRRVGSRRRAAAAMEAAIDGFLSVGCAPWAERARAELARVGIQRRSDQLLSPGEERIARMAASGMTNQRIAERLLISRKTVEASLARAYLKLGIHTRAELGARMATMGSPTTDGTDEDGHAPTASGSTT